MLQTILANHRRRVQTRAKLRSEPRFTELCALDRRRELERRLSVRDWPLPAPRRCSGRIERLLRSGDSALYDLALAH